MPKGQRKNHLSSEHKRLICRLFAEFAEPTEVQAAVEKTFGFRLALSTLYHYRDSEKWKAVVLEMRKELLRHLEDLPIASKYWRLKQLCELFASENRYRVVRYSGKSEIPIEEKPVGELRQLLALAAEELGELKRKVEHEVGSSLEEIIAGALPDRGSAAGK